MTMCWNLLIAKRQGKYFDLIRINIKIFLNDIKRKEKKNPHLLKKKDK